MPEQIDLRILTFREAAQALGKPETWLLDLIRKGKGPVARRISPGRMCIKLSDLQQWLDGLEHVGRKRMYAMPDPELHFDEPTDGE
jgi:predicted DNA-binding transcriptional regulator AlpA